MLNGAVLMNMLWIIIVIYVGCITAQRAYPDSPCPDRFMYTVHNGEVQGLIKVTNIEINRSNEVMAVTTNDAGSWGDHILTVKNERTIFDDVKNRRPIWYRLKFRPSPTIPEVIEIKANDVIICKSDRVINGYASITHTLLLEEGYKRPGHKQIQTDYDYPDYAQIPQWYRDYTQPNPPFAVPQVTRRPRPTTAQPARNRQSKPTASSAIPKLPTTAQPARNHPSKPTAGSAIPELLWKTFDEDSAEPAVNNNSNSLSCGRVALDRSTINLVWRGEKFKPGEWPWLAAIFDLTQESPTQLICGGTIIKPDAVITAAHCVVKNGITVKKQNIAVGLGKFDLTNRNEKGTYTANVKSIKWNPEYARRSSHDADLAIIILTKAYSYNNRIQPACIWSSSLDPQAVVEAEAKVAGWGISRPGGKIELEPTIVTAQIVSNDVCLQSHELFRTAMSPRNFCAGYRNGSGPCEGDSGGGLLLNIGNRWYLRGLVSGALPSEHAVQTCDLNHYVIYTDIAEFLEWIGEYIDIE